MPSCFNPPPKCILYSITYQLKRFLIHAHKSNFILIPRINLLGTICQTLGHAWIQDSPQKIIYSTYASNIVLMGSCWFLQNQDGSALFSESGWFHCITLYVCIRGYFSISLAWIWMISLHHPVCVCVRGCFSISLALPYHGWLLLLSLLYQDEITWLQQALDHRLSYLTSSLHTTGGECKNCFNPSSP
jgi:hypothetical protein